MDSFLRLAATPGTPLFPVSPERVNQQRSVAVDMTPTPTPSRIPFDSQPSSNSHLRSASDLQGIVGPFDSANDDCLDSKKRHSTDTPNQARTGKEEAEAELAGFLTENEQLLREVEEGKQRERRVAKRLESMMIPFRLEDAKALQDEMRRKTETSCHSQALLEKELRAARKEIFKLSSGTVKLREKIKASRDEHRKAQEELEQQRRMTADREQDAFKAKYELVGVLQELERMCERVKTVEGERDVLKASLKEEEIARIAAEGMIALPVSHEMDDGLDLTAATPSVHQMSRRQCSAENTPLRIDPVEALPVSPTGFAKTVKEAAVGHMDRRDDEEVVVEGTGTIDSPKLDSTSDASGLDWRLEEQVKAQQRLVEDTNGLIEFMLLECQFKSCPCRRAERVGEVYAYDKESAAVMIAEEANRLSMSRGSAAADDEEEVIPARPNSSPAQLSPLPLSHSPAASPANHLPPTPLPRQRHEPARRLPSTPGPRPGPGPAVASRRRSHRLAHLPPDASLLSLLDNEPASQPPPPSHSQSHSHSSLQSQPAEGPEDVAGVVLPQSYQQQQHWNQSHHYQQQQQQHQQHQQQQQQQHVYETNHQQHYYTYRPEVTTTTRTTTVPLAPLSPPEQAHQSAPVPTSTREERLAAIQMRRGRSRSVASGLLTPAKQISQSVGHFVASPFRSTSSTSRPRSSSRPSQRSAASSRKLEQKDPEQQQQKRGKESKEHERRGYHTRSRSRNPQQPLPVSGGERRNRRDVSAPDTARRAARHF
ncbi:MAG: hypothetical protein M1825_004681 [Sarcosagium campestre]|nr:MAG: hypothetical protein M1825_004681 [Sarcosagium campestre]